MRRSIGYPYLPVLLLLLAVARAHGAANGDFGIWIEAGSGRPYAVLANALESGARQYIDRPLRWAHVPDELVGATYIQTANDDKLSRAPGFLRIESERPLRVYVARDKRIKQIPEWLDAFERTGLELRSDDITTRGFALYAKEFPAGVIELGGNEGDAGNRCMYGVVLVEAGVEHLPPVVEASLDRRIYWPTRSSSLYGSAEAGDAADASLRYEWSLVEGPAPVRFEDPHAPLTEVFFQTTGIYRLRLLVRDGELERADDMRISVLPPIGMHERAAQHAEAAREGFHRAHRFLVAWMERADPQTGLIPRGLRGPNLWSGRDAAADCYPFMVLTAALTHPEALAGRMREMLETERRITPRLGLLPDIWDLTRQAFFYPEPDLARIQFNTSEYVKDGLLPITEWLGHSPWSDRMEELVDACWAAADVRTPAGPIVSTDHENNGEMLQVLPRLYWKTGEPRYLEWALRLGDYYLLGTNHPTRDFKELRLRDHGCEVVSGLCELYVTLRYADPDRADAYRAPLYAMLDRILEVGVDEDGFFYDIIRPQSGEVVQSRRTDTFAYNYNGYLAVSVVDEHEPYRAAIRKVLLHLPSHPAFNGGEAMDGNADALEGALYLYNRRPRPSLVVWLDDAARELWTFQKEDGTINGNYLDGNFARSTLLYALWKTQGIHVQPWREDLRLGAVREGERVYISLRADAPWAGRLIFDRPRHRDYFRLPYDWPRINQFSPEWTTIDVHSEYELEEGGAPATRLPGSVLTAGLPLVLQAGEVREWVLVDASPPVPTRITTRAGRRITGGRIRLVGIGQDLQWTVRDRETGHIVAGGEGPTLNFDCPPNEGDDRILQVLLDGARGRDFQELILAGTRDVSVVRNASSAAE